jgi:hypothetical protein
VLGADSSSASALASARHHTCGGRDELGHLASRRPDERRSRGRSRTRPSHMGSGRTVTPVVIDQCQLPTITRCYQRRFQRWTPIVSAHSAPRPHATRWRSVSRRACQLRRARDACPRALSSPGAPTVHPARSGMGTSVPDVLRRHTGPRQNAPHEEDRGPSTRVIASTGIGPRIVRA